MNFNLHDQRKFTGSFHPASRADIVAKIRHFSLRRKCPFSRAQFSVVVPSHPRILSCPRNVKLPKFQHSGWPQIPPRSYTMFCRGSTPVLTVISLLRRLPKFEYARHQHPISTKCGCEEIGMTNWRLSLSLRGLVEPR